MPTLPLTRAAAVLLGVLLLSGCRRTEAEYQKLVGENEYLKQEITRLNRRATDEREEEKKGAAAAGEPDLKMTIVDMWSQRFDDNEFRAKQRLGNKLIRITGAVDGVAAEMIGLGGVSKRFGNIRMSIHLVNGYATRIAEGLAALERGTVVTVQGKFLYDRMILSEAVFVDQNSGRTLYTDDLLSLSAGLPVLVPVPLTKPAPPPASPAPAPATPAPASAAAGEGARGGRLR